MSPFLLGFLALLSCSPDFPLETLETFEAGTASTFGFRSSGFWTLIAAGDLMPGRGSEPLLLQKDFKDVFNDTLPLILQADLALANLETTVTLWQVPWLKSYNFKVSPEIVSILKKAGWDVLTIANNHSWDYGETGFLDTLQAMEENGIPAPGAGRDGEESSLPFVTSFSGQPVRVLSLGGFPVERSGFSGRMVMKSGVERPGILWADEDGLSTVRQAMSDHQAFDIVMLHAGYENTKDTAADIKILFRSVIDAGADLVIGHHPHVVHSWEQYHGSYILYSLGDFLFDGMWDNPAALDGVFFRALLKGSKIHSFQWIPTIIEGPRVRLRREGDGIENYPEIVSEHFKFD